MGDNEIKIRYVLAKEAKMPLIASDGSAGWDCFALHREFLTIKDGQIVQIKAEAVKDNDLVRYWTGFSVEIPGGYVGLTFARSSIVKMPLIMANTTGVIDSDYRGEVSFVFRILKAGNIQKTAYQIGDRVGQLVFLPLPAVQLIKTDRLSDSQRGAGSYGSTGK